MNRRAILILAVSSALSLAACSSPAGSSGGGSAKGSITGHASYSNQSNSSGIVVSLDSVDSSGRTVAVSRSIASRSLAPRSLAGQTTTNASGAYTISGLSAGVYTVYASGNSTLEKAVFTQVTVTAGRTVSVDDLQLTATGSITGTATVNGVGQQGVLVYIAGTSYQAWTDSSGAYTISSVPAASGYHLIASSPGYTDAPAASALTVTGGASTTAPSLNLTPVPATAGTVTGSVTLAGQPAGAYAGTFVFLVGTTSYWAVSTPDGSFSFSGAAPGSYTLTATRQGYPDASESVTVAAGSNTAPALTLTAASLTLNIASADLVLGLGPYQLSATVSPTGPVTWTSSAPAVATVDSTGLVTTVALGTTTITASAGGKTAQQVLTVHGIFAAGNVQSDDANPSHTLPAYWVDGVLHVLPTTVGSPYGSIQATDLHGDDFYSAGFISDEDGNHIGALWKNDLLQPQPSLPSGVSYSGDTYDLKFDSSGNMYRRGAFTKTVGPDTNPIPGFIKNGTFTALSLDLPDGTAPYGDANEGTYFLQRDDGGIDAYFSGYLSDPVTGNNVPVYWKNGVVHVVPLGSLAAFGNNGDVNCIIPSSQGSPTIIVNGYDDAGSHPAYVMNGGVVPISSAPFTSSNIWWVWTAPSGDIYAQGQVKGQAGGPGGAYYWKNWALTPAIVPSGLAGLQTYNLNGVQLSGNDLLMNSVFSDAAGLNKAAYWLNDNDTYQTLPLSDGTTTYVGASAQVFGFNNE